jgi:hypothetical protein
MGIINGNRTENQRLAFTVDTIGTITTGGEQRQYSSI